MSIHYQTRHEAAPGLVRLVREVVMFVVFYAKVVNDKDDGIYISDIHFGGVAGSLPEAESVAKDCVNTVSGGTILPKIYPLEGTHQLVPIMLTAVRKFRVQECEMFEAEDILERNASRKH